MLISWLQVQRILLPRCGMAAFFERLVGLTKSTRKSFVNVEWDGHSLSRDWVHGNDRLCVGNIHDKHVVRHCIVERKWWENFFEVALEHKPACARQRYLVSLKEHLANECYQQCRRANGLFFLARFEEDCTWEKDHKRVAKGKRKAKGRQKTRRS